MGFYFGADILTPFTLVLLGSHSLLACLIAWGMGLRGLCLIPIYMCYNECPHAQHGLATKLLAFLLPSAFACMLSSVTSVKCFLEMFKLCLKYDFR